MTDYVMIGNVLKVLSEHIRQDEAGEMRRIGGYCSLAARMTDKEEKDNDESR